MTLYKTGDKAPEKGNYEFVRYVDGTTTPTPSSDEWIIPLDKGETFPPVKSSEKSAYRKKI